MSYILKPAALILSPLAQHSDINTKETILAILCALFHVPLLGIYYVL